MYPFTESFTFEAASKGENRRALAESFSLLGYLREAGYYNVTLQPANTLKPKQLFWGTHEQVDMPDLPYDGPHFGFAHVPDQYSLSYTHHTYPPKAGQPYALFFETGSSHMPWPVPPLLPSDHVEDSGAYGKPTSTRSVQVPDDTHPWIKTLAYTFAVVDDYLSCCARPEAVVVLLGDHQPPNLDACDSGDYAVPVHFVTRTGSGSGSASDATKDWQEGLELSGSDRPSLEQNEVGSFILRRLGATPISKQAMP